MEAKPWYLIFIMDYPIENYNKNFYKGRYLIDRCINCGDPKQILDIAFLIYQDGKSSMGPICKDCYSANKK